MDSKSIDYLLNSIIAVCALIIVMTAMLGLFNPVTILLLVLGIYLLLWSAWTMTYGKFRISEDISRKTRLMAKGPYRYIRNPIYSSLILITLSLILTDLNTLRVVVWLIMVGVTMLSIDRTEKRLAKELSDYSLYKQRTKRIIPYIY